MKQLKILVEGYKNKNYQRVRRGDESYRQTYDLTKQELERLVKMYQEHFSEDQTARLLRDSIDHWIRRYHDYCVRGSIGSHYREVGVVQGASVFEHVIPASSVRDMLIEGRLTIDQALNAPTCLIKKDSDDQLRKNGLSSTSPDNWNFFKRYSVLGSHFTTYNGKDIPDQWSLEDHFKMFNIN